MPVRNKQPPNHPLATIYNNKTTMQDADNYKILKPIEQNSEISQRQLARQLGVSLGKTNYCLKALINVGIIKAKR